MTIDDAIKFQETYLRSPICNLSKFEREATQLGIEALKHLQQERLLHTYPAYKLLPGETK